MFSVLFDNLTFNIVAHTTFKDIFSQINSPVIFSYTKRGKFISFKRVEIFHLVTKYENIIFDYD